MHDSLRLVIDGAQGKAFCDLCFNLIACCVSVHFLFKTYRLLTEPFGESFKLTACCVSVHFLFKTCRLLTEPFDESFNLIACCVSVHFLFKTCRLLTEPFGESFTSLAVWAALAKITSCAVRASYPHDLLSLYHSAPADL
jgi:hypothetical protein